MTTTTKTLWLHDFLGVRDIPADLARAIYAAADEGGVIQADDMVRLLPGANPRCHTTTLLVDALRAAGATIVRPDDVERCV